MPTSPGSYAAGVVMTLGLVSGMAVAAFGAVVLGEYEFAGFTPWVAGAVLGLVVGEAVVTVGRVRSVEAAGITAVFAAGGVLYAAWISAGEGIGTYPLVAFPAAVVAALSSGWRVWPPKDRSGISPER